MSFFHPQLLWLIAIPVLLFVWDCLRRKPAAHATGKILSADAGPAGIKLTPNAARKSSVRWRLCLGLIFVSLALARPQWGRIEEPVFDQAREILVAIDLSRSMLADDVKPTRLDRARLLTQSLLENTPGERVGLVVFAGTAFLQSPLSSDHEIIRDFLPLLDPTFLPAGGTDYQALLKTSLDAFSDSPADRFLVVLSDGEAAKDDWRELAEKCHERNIRVLTLGIGTSAGAMLPDGQGGLIKNENGAVVLSKIDDTTLRQMAELTGGVYTDASQWVDLAALIKSTVSQGRQGEFKEAGHVRLGERYQWALAPAFLLLLWSLWREFPIRADGAARKWQARTNRASIAAMLALALLAVGIPPSSQAAEDSKTLPDLVAKLVAQPRLSVADYATLAQSTLTYGQGFQSQGKPAPAGPVNDALTAVAEGKKLAPAATNWDQLKTALEKLLEPPPKQQPPPSEDQKQPDKNESDDSKKSDEKSDKSDENKSGDKSDQDQSKSGESDSSQDQKKGDPSDQKSDGKPGEKSDKQDGQDSSSEQQSDDQSGKEQSQGKPGDPSQEHKQAFGDMNEEGQEKPEQKNQQSVPGEPKEPQPQPEGETQRVGGAPTGSQTSTDPALMQTLQRLEQLKTQDSPARLFQLLQDPNDQPPAPRGQTW